MCRLIISAAIIAIFIVGCSSSSTNDPKGSSAAAAVVGPEDAAQSSAASGAVGAATDAGISQLFSGGTAAKAMLDPQPTIAWQTGHDAVMHDGPSPLAAVVRSVDTSPTPAISAGVITAGINYGGSGASGTILYQIDNTGLPANSYHIALTFDASHTLSLHTENGDTAIINSGELDIYVTTTLLSADGAGNWNFKIDHYSTMPTSNPITVNVTTSNGGSWVTRITGLRHGARDYVRTRTPVAGSLPTIRLSETLTIDGDFSGFPTATGAALANPGNGPSFSTAGGETEIFTKWVLASVSSAGGRHTLIWDRYATFGLSYVRTGGTALTVSVNAPFDNVYITKDSLPPVGPLSAAGFSSRFHVVSDLTQSAQDR